MNDMSPNAASQFAVGAITLAATRDAAVRAEILKVGDPVRILDKTGYSGAKVHTGVIVGFEPFKDLPTVIVAYVEVDYSKAEMKMLYYTGEQEKFQILAAPEDINIDIERSRVLEWFSSERRKKQAELDELAVKEQYFERYFGSIMAEVKQLSADTAVEA